jgi:catechol 2,3-dioxygenase-like lactoylglutathione lyase family enzyme
MCKNQSVSSPAFDIDHVSVSVTDIEAARSFYGELLGFDEIERPDFGFPGAWYRVGATPLHLTTGGDTRGADASLRPNDPHLAVAVDGDLDAFLNGLRAAGVPVIELENSPAALRQTFVKDPWGNVIEFCVNHPIPPNTDRPNSGSSRKRPRP